MYSGKLILMMRVRFLKTADSYIYSIMQCAYSSVLPKIKSRHDGRVWSVVTSKAFGLFLFPHQSLIKAVPVLEACRANMP